MQCYLGCQWVSCVVLVCSLYDMRPVNGTFHTPPRSFPRSFLKHQRTPVHAAMDLQQLTSPLSPAHARLGHRSSDKGQPDLQIQDVPRVLAGQEISSSVSQY